MANISSNVTDNGISVVEEDVDAVTIEQQKLTPDIQNYITELGAQKPFIKDITVDSRHVILEFSKFWPVLPGRKKQAAKLWKIIEGIILSNPTIKVSPMVMVRIAVGGSEISATALPDPNQSGIIASFNVVEGILRRYMVPPSDKAQVSEEMGVPSGLVVTCQSMGMLINPLSDNRKLGMGAGNLYTERALNTTTNKNDPNEELPIGSSEEPKVTYDYPQHAPAGESSSGLKNAVEAALAIEAVKKLEEAHRKEDEERGKRIARQNGLLPAEMAGIESLAENQTNAEREITGTGDDGNGSGPERPENGSLVNAESSTSQQEREQWEGTTEMERRSLEGITEQEREAREGITEMERETEQGIQEQDQEAQEGIAEQERLAQEGIGEQELVAQEGIGEQELVAQEGIAEQERRAQEGIVDQEDDAQEGIAEQERRAQEGVGEQELVAQQISTRMERQAQEGSTELEQKAQEGSTSIERQAQVASTEIEQRDQVSSSEVEQRGQVISTELEQRGQVGSSVTEQRAQETSTVGERQGQENINGLEQKAQDSSPEAGRRVQETPVSEPGEQKAQENTSVEPRNQQEGQSVEQRQENGARSEVPQEVRGQETRGQEGGQQVQSQQSENRVEPHFNAEQSNELQQERDSSAHTRYGADQSGQHTVSHQQPHQRYESATQSHGQSQAQREGGPHSSQQDGHISSEVGHGVDHLRQQHTVPHQTQRPSPQSHTANQVQREQGPHNLQQERHVSSEIRQGVDRSGQLHTAPRQQLHQTHEAGTQNRPQTQHNSEHALHAESQTHHAPSHTRQENGQASKHVQSRAEMRPTQVQANRSHIAPHSQDAHATSKAGPEKSSAPQARRNGAGQPKVPRDQVKASQERKFTTNDKTKSQPVGRASSRVLQHQDSPQPSVNGTGTKLREKNLAGTTTPRRSDVEKKLSSRMGGNRPTSKTGLMHGTKLSTDGLVAKQPRVASSLGGSTSKYAGVKVASDRAQATAHMRRNRQAVYKGVKQTIKNSAAIQQQVAPKTAVQAAPALSPSLIPKLVPDI